MIQYDLYEINPGHYMKVLKCLSKKYNYDGPISTSVQKRKPLIVIIPGNPGVIEFYEKLAIAINKTTDYDVIGLSHTGHIYDEKVKTWEAIDVKTQVNDKLKFIETYLLNNCIDFNNNNEDPLELIFIGHSIGCYIILEMLSFLDDRLKNRVKKAFLLFPTIERMAETPSGKKLTFLTTFFLWFILFLAYLITFFPKFVQNIFINLFFTRHHNDLNENLNNIIINMCNSYHCVRSCFLMGKNEMHYVKKLNTHLIKKNSNILTFYYGANDSWCPQSYYNQMKNYLHDLKKNLSVKTSPLIKKETHPKIFLDNYNMDHAFVIYRNQCSIMANLIKDWLN